MRSEGTLIQVFPEIRCFYFVGGFGDSTVNLAGREQNERQKQTKRE